MTGIAATPRRGAECLAMQALQIALRIVHIGAGIAWVGSVFFLMVFLLPAARAVGGQAAPLLVYISRHRRLTAVIATAATLNVAAGLVLYWLASNHLDPSFFSTPRGIGLTVGGISALIAYPIGVVIVRKASDRMADLGEAILKSGGPPTPEQGAEIAALQARMHTWGWRLLTLLTITVIAMASSRYLY